MCFIKQVLCIGVAFVLFSSFVDFTSLASQAIPAVVSIQVKEMNRQRDPFDSDGSLDSFLQRFFSTPRGNAPQEATGQASGFIVSPDGYIITNSHVVRDTSEMFVLLNDGQRFSAQLIGQDPNTDIALIKIDAQHLPYLKLGNSDALKVGQPVAAIGAPLGLQASMTTGIVSAKGRNNLDLARVEDFIQTDAALNRGNSGGPLLSLNGEVVGVNTAIASTMGGYTGIGFAIPSNIAKNVMDQLLSKGSVSRGFLGIALQDVDKDLAHAFGLKQPEGILIAQVTKGSPAEKAGLKQGDILLKYDHTPILNGAAFRLAVALMSPGTKLNLSLLREGQLKEMSVQIGEATIPSTTTKNALGISVEELSPEIAHKLGLHDEKGVYVTQVESGSIASWAGLRKGAVILSVNRRNVESVQQFQDALQDIEKDRPILLLIRDGSSMRFLSFKP